MISNSGYRTARDLSMIKATLNIGRISFGGNDNLNVVISSDSVDGFIQEITRHFSCDDTVVLLSMEKDSDSLCYSSTNAIYDCGVDFINSVDQDDFNNHSIQNPDENDIVIEPTGSWDPLSDELPF